MGVEELGMEVGEALWLESYCVFFIDIFIDTQFMCLPSVSLGFFLVIVLFQFFRLDPLLPLCFSHF